jgi:hypothetical protein
MPVIFYVVLGLIIFGVVALLLTPNLFRPSPEAQRILDVVSSERVDQRDETSGPGNGAKSQAGVVGKPCTQSKTRHGGNSRNS